jgi:hypothetical protein
MKTEYVVRIATDNAAFEDALGNETARILHQLANWIEGIAICLPDLPLRDINGNHVGAACWHVTK